MEYRGVGMNGSEKVATLRSIRFNAATFTGEIADWTHLSKPRGAFLSAAVSERLNLFRAVEKTNPMGPHKNAVRLNLPILFFAVAAEVQGVTTR